MSRAVLFFLISQTALTIGCQKEPPQPAPVAPRQAVSKLTVFVVNDSPIATGLNLLRGEWAERTGGQLDIREGTVDQLLGASELSADLLIYPSRHVGALVDREWLRPLRKSVLQSAELALDDMLPLIRNATLSYGGQIYALSFGEPPLMLVSTRDGLPQEKLSTWRGLGIRMTAENSPLNYPRAAELIVRGTACAQHRSQTTGWFDLESMQPRIATPPFVRALQQMLDSAKRVAEHTEPRLALSWPTVSKDNLPKPPTFVPLPRADVVYDPLRDTWEKNHTDQPLVVLGFAGRSVSVSRSTRNSASAFKLIKWLISTNISTQLSSRSNATVWFRKSQAAEAKKWLAKSGASGETANAVTKLLSSSDYFLLPRIPGIDDYLLSLEQAVAQAITQEMPAKEALSEAETLWNALTDRYGRDRQRKAYRKHLGLVDSEE